MVLKAVRIACGYDGGKLVLYATDGAGAVWKQETVGIDPVTHQPKCVWIKECMDIYVPPPPPPP